MPSTSISSRQPPSRVFENYVFSRVISPDTGLINVSNDRFVTCSPGQIAEGSDPGAGYSSSGISSPISIGFNFQIDGIVYKQFCACVNGYIVLVDPQFGTFSSTEVFSGNNNQNDTIKTTFTTNAALLAVWFGPIMRNVASDVQQLQNSGLLISSDKATRILTGLEPPPVQLSARENAVKYTNVNTPTGRALVVRWNTLISDTQMANSVSGAGCRAKFEIVIYENGTIEYRYATRKQLKLTLGGVEVESATIGVFMPGTGRWRDFSSGLGYRDHERTPYKFGGYIKDNLYTDRADSPTDDGGAASYTVNLKSSIHWPARRGMSALFTFVPPFMRRKILPRNSIKELGTRSNWPQATRITDMSGLNDKHFDDRKTIAFTSGVINYPTTLPRFYGNGEPGIVARQDLFVGDFEITGSTSISVADQFVGKGFTKFLNPFNENKQFENTVAASTDIFYKTGSNVELFGTNISQPLKTKTQLRLGLLVNNKVAMPAFSSSIYYYNSADGAWEIPQNSGYVIGDQASSVPSGVTLGDIAKASLYAAGGRLIEDVRGFGPVGNTVSSGSRSSVTQSTDPYIDRSYDPKEIIDALDRNYEKSVRVNPLYEAVQSETFVLPINKPFLLEKAVIELPIAAGDGWFKNLTTNYVPISLISTGSDPGFDFAGPALTVALFNQIKVGNKTRRELILTGTITHTFDNTAQIKFSNDPGTSNTYRLRPVGFNAFANPGAVITPVSTSKGYFFTGSVVVPCEASITNGVFLKYSKLPSNFSTAIENRQSMRDLFASPTISIYNVTSNTGSLERATLAYISPFGRAGTGIGVSGRSVFGGDFVLFPGSAGTPSELPNPFYITGSVASKTGTASGLPAQIEAAISTGTSSFDARAMAAVFIGNHRTSPYLVNPGDHLILSISKTRPFVYSLPALTGSAAREAPYVTSGSIRDDITLNTGSINIVFYGSMLQNASEVHGTLGQQLTSDSIHEVIGDELVLDQYELAFRDEYVGGMFDDYITGSLIDKTTGPNGNVVLQASISPRGRVFSSYDAATQPMLQYSGTAFLPNRTTGNQENITNPSKNFRLQPWFEKVGTPRVLKMTSPNERMWDSMLPSFVECMSADGKGIGITAQDVSPISFVHRSSGTYGYIHFDNFDTDDQITNHRWTRSFPFEPHYAGATRLFDISTSFVATYYFDAGLGELIQISATPIAGFFIGTDTIGAAANPGALATIFYGDANLSNTILTSFGFPIAPLEFYSTSSLGINDQLRVLYGFGDRRSLNNLGDPIGPDKFAEFRDIGEFSRNEDGDPTGDLHNRDNRVVYGVRIRGWKYGILNGLPTFNCGYWRQGHYGQFRDMLEQRPFTKFYHVPDPNVSGLSTIAGQTTSVVTVKFINPTTNTITEAERTWSQNLSFEATSSLPYFDGQIRNREEIDTSTLNTSVVFITQGGDGQITL